MLTHIPRYSITMMFKRVNSAELLPFQFEGKHHECVAELLTFSKLRPDLESTRNFKGKPAEGKSGDLYTDSAYEHGVCHLFGAVWKQQGFKKADGTPIQHYNTANTTINECNDDAC